MSNIPLNKEHREYFVRCSAKTLQSNENGFFLQFADQVAEVAGKKWIANIFGKLKTDRERIRALFEYKPVKEAICETLSHVQEIYHKKSASVSKARRLAADKFLENDQKQKALLLYSQSVLRAPPTGEEPAVDDGFSLALAYWSRSQMLINLKKYSHAITDIQLAMKEYLSDQYHAEAYKNMALCYKALKDQCRAKISFAISERMLQGDIERLKKYKEEFDKQVVVEEKKTRKQLPVIEDVQKTELPNASKKLTVKEDSDKGRYVVAKEDIKTGETLVVEAPYAACLLPDCFGTHCHHCFEKLIAPVGCTDCCSLAFCKPECRDAALSTYHKYECRFLDLLIGSGMSILSHTALRMITQSNLQKCLEIYKDRSKERVYSLCTNAEKRPAEDFLQRTIMAVFLLRILQKSGYFEDGCANEDVVPVEEEFQIGELLLYHLQMLQFNAHEIYETRHGPEHRLKEAKTVYIGVAVYPTVALFNHDCYPAVLRYFVGKNIVINSSRPLSPGDTVSENYGPIFTWKNVDERQKSLAARYWFKCQCLACTHDWPSLKNGLEKASRRLRCPTSTCSSVYTLPLGKQKLTCPACRKQVNLSSSLDEIKLCDQLYETATEAFLAEEVEKGISIICEAIDTFHRVSVPPHRETHLAQETLRAFMAEFGNIFEMETVK